MRNILGIGGNPSKLHNKLFLGKLIVPRKFNDVTLVSEDYHQIRVHRVILAAASPVGEKLKAPDIEK